MTPDQFPSARTPLLVEVFYLEDHEPLICGIHGLYSSQMVESIEKDLAEEPWQFFEKGQGTYVYEAVWIEAQVGELGRVELPGYYDLSLVGFQRAEDL